MISSKLRILLLLTVALMNGCEKDTDDEEIDWFIALKGATFSQIDRVGFPGVDNFLIADTDIRHKLNTKSPSDDIATAKEVVREQVESIRQKMLEVANSEIPVLNETSTDALASMAIPNVITVDLGSAPAFPSNGRKLEDDVYDSVLKLIFDRAITDGIESSTTFSSDFPFVPSIPIPTP